MENINSLFAINARYRERLSLPQAVRKLRGIYPALFAACLIAAVAAWFAHPATCWAVELAHPPYGAWAGKSATSPSTIAETTIDDAAAGWVWSGMHEYDDPAMRGGSGHAGPAGGHGAYTFQGTGVSVYVMAGPSVTIDGRAHKMGSMKISIDGRLKANELLLRDDTQYNVVGFSQTGMAPGNHVIQIEAEGGWIVVDYLEVWSADPPTELQRTSVPNGVETLPYLSTPARVPGFVYAANYDRGGQNVAYFDTTTGNSGGAYRHDDVDIEACRDTGVSFDVGDTAAGEWLKYTVDVDETRTYSLTFRVASLGPGWLHVEDEHGLNLTGPVAVSSTGGWQQWTSITGQVTLTAGTHVLKLCEDTGGYNIAWLRFQ